MTSPRPTSPVEEAIVFDMNGKPWYKGIRIVEGVNIIEKDTVIWRVTNLSDLVDQA